MVKLVEQREVNAKEVFTFAEEQYIPTYPQVVQLTDQDIELIQQALEVNRSTGNYQPVLAIVQKVQSKLGIQTDLPPVKFLYIVIKDYGHITAGN